MAKRIARAIFTSGTGKRADRLVLMREPAGKPKQDLGGWSERAMADHLESMLLADGAEGKD